ncbi:Epidermal growth factor receptor kinase substrate 8-like protein 3 [Platysternon megacephalum]|uniref:Epidermal growth factor receptor kinase substrate 8-like protein 3 n=1 Tax=Platysternon megacephalum TaxID=55544 RepID=A0A4D9DSQ9_9SAUR|nr:Epidermal growth factor receptor kinase substrate 8-like protein 3 [Platysternon megacephalum]
MLAKKSEEYLQVLRDWQAENTFWFAWFTNTSDIAMVLEAVRSMYHNLDSISEPLAQQELCRALVLLGYQYSEEVVINLLGCSLSCDSVAAEMWRMLTSHPKSTGKVLQELLKRLQEQLLRQHHDVPQKEAGVAPLAATRALYEILQEPACRQQVQELFPQLYIALLLQITYTVELSLQDIALHWRVRNQEDTPTPLSPIRCAVKAMKALLPCAGYGDQVTFVQNQGSWDMLVSSDTHHKGIGLLARAMVPKHFQERSWIFHQLMAILDTRDDKWHVPAMVFFIHRWLLQCPDLSNELEDAVLEQMSRQLRDPNTIQTPLQPGSSPREGVEQSLVEPTCPAGDLAPSSGRRIRTAVPGMAKSTQGLLSGPTMMEHFGYGTESQNNEFSNGSPDFIRANSTSRPSSKAIYRQRKDYTLSTLKQQSDFQHRVEHLLTVYVDSKDIRGVDDCVARLKMMDAQGRVWGQDMILQVRSHELLLSDIETKEELESYPLESVQECAAVLNRCVYNSILAVTVREQSQHGSSILLFQCEQLGAELMKANLEKAVKDWKGERESQDVLRSSLETMLSQHSRGSFHSNPPHTSQDRWAGPPEPDPFIPPTSRGWQSQDQVPRNPPASMDYAPDQPRPPKPRDEWTDPSLQATQDFNKDTEILNHVLSDIELFVGKLKEMSGSLSSKKKSKKKDKERGVLPPEPEYETCFQKIKYALNLLGKLKPKLQQQPPSAPELVRIIFSTLSIILSNCPWPNLASSIISPLLTEAAIDLLDESLEKKDRDTWKSLGKAWHTTRTEYPDGQFIPPYIPIFSDGWVPPLPTQRENATHVERQPLGSQNHAASRAPSSPPQRRQAMYEFQARNNKELTVMKGELLEVRQELSYEARELFSLY